MKKNSINILETGQQRMTCIDIQSKLLQNGIIMISEEITSDTVVEYQEQLFYLMSKYNKGDIITIYINSPGGSVYDGLGLYDIIQIIKSKGIIVRTINIGKAASMASILLMCGTKGYRESTENSSVMIHEISTWEYGKTPEIRDATEELNRLQKTIDEIISKHSDPKLIDLCSRKDLWLSAKDAIEYNIIDKIL